MFDYIRGELVSKNEGAKGTYFTVDVCGVGYRFEILPIDFKSDVNIGEEVKLFTVLIHKEDIMYLCGFLHKETRDIFKILTSVSGVGVKMALTLLNEFTPRDLIAFVINENSKELTKAKGVGTKLAQKIILELKDKLINLQPILSSDINADVPKEAEDVQKVLLSLGYDEFEIKDAITRASEVVTKNSTSEEFLRTALQILSV